ncbi:ATP-binding cassette domain-containing protein [Paenibacillus sp. UNC451MF]|uniref:ATP-binding cassette domain-containing protein n=1 Tax=Paenibacillus sp. UNC451MF TaxID=1449063 RepID=UPI001E388BD9|nr:ABC transporter ATP-binding protein [Paenibacillus sp. UNC451MF]
MADARPVKVKPTADFVNFLLMPAQLLLLKWVVDLLTGWNDGLIQQDLIIAGIGLAIVMILQAIIGRTSLLAHNRLNEIGTYEVERAVLEKNAKLSLTLLETPSIKDLRTRAFRASPEILFLNSYSYFFQAVQTVLLLLILVWFGQWIFALLFLFTLPIQLPLRSYAARRAELLEQEQTPQRRRAHYIAQLMTSRNPAKEIRLLDLGSYFQMYWMRLHNQNAEEMVKRKIKEQQLLVPSDLLVTLLSALMTAIVLLVAATHGNSPGEITLLLQIAIMLGGLWPGLLDLHTSLKQQGARWDEMRRFLQLEEDATYIPTLVDDKSKGSIPTTSHMTAEAVLVRQLTFTYEGRANPSLQEVSFYIEAGEKIAIVGENGSGKSTLVKLLMGLYSPGYGSVEWYSKDGAPLTATEAACSFTAVLQDFTKMNLLVREQIALGSIDRLYDDQALLTAQKHANAHPWGLNLDDRIGPEFGGLELSGGQWQSLAAARGYVRKGSVLFFDEPTSALDPQAEKTAIMDFLRIAGDRTSFLVTHRLGAARMADRILVLQNGRLVEQGTHRQLMAARGEYERLYRLQASWYV